MNHKVRRDEVSVYQAASTGLGPGAVAGEGGAPSVEGTEPA